MSCSWTRRATVLVLLGAMGACATNPATGKKELMLVSEGQEVALGQQEDQKAVASFGVYDHPALQDYVASVGHSIAERAERPNLPWTFRLVDDAAVNAFALPGGFVYLKRLDGMTFGENPREGSFRKSAFYHPELRFRFELPRAFKGQNTKQAVWAVSPSGFDATSGQTPVLGVAAFVLLEGRIYRMIGYTGQANWSRYSRSFADSLSSFAPLRERSALDVQPRRVDIVIPRRDLTLAQFMKQYTSTVPESTIAVLNQLHRGDTFKARRQAKRITGGDTL